MPQDGVLSQSFATTPGQSYILAFDLGAFSLVNQNEQRMLLTVQGASTLLSRTISVFASGTGGRYQPQSFTFVADSPTTTLTFTDASPTTASVDLLLDNVRLNLSTLPVITSQPQSQTVAVGGSATLNVVASGQNLSYQWRFNSASIAGATASSYTVNNAQSANAGNYDVVVSNSSGSVASSVAVLTVGSGSSGPLSNGGFESGYVSWAATGNQEVSTDSSVGATEGTHFVWFNARQGAPNAVLSQSFATTAGQGYVLALDVGAFSFVNLNEQRLRVALQGTGALASQTLSVFAPGNGTRWTAKTVSFVADSATTTLTLTDVSPTTQDVDLLLDNVRLTLSSAPVITSQPQSQSVAAGGSATFTVVASGQNLAYQWRFNGGNITGATASSYTINNAQSANAGNYDVVVSNSSGAVTSTAAVLTVGGGSSGPLSNGGFESGYLSWTATGNQEVSTDSSVGATEGTHFVWFNARQGAPNAVLSQSFATTAGQGYVLALDVGAFSFVNLNEQRLRVALQGSGALASQTLSVFAPGNGTRWTAKTVSFVADSATTTLTLTDVSPTTQDVDLLLDNVRLTLSSAPVITSQPQSQSVAAGGSATFTVVASGQNLAYQWRFNGGNITGATASSYTINNAQSANAGNYDVVVSNSSGVVTSTAAVLSVNGGSSLRL